ncbi:hypothetical protein Taro_047026 [Colocasia esculenta]|uniref:Uncharacterized protein n=1 Tax=Colocasia esculenta TaxID=4460 RepID=A0A843X012_COLES|nr:hypothetical protein [Colocasia esculenta]
MDLADNVVCRRGAPQLCHSCRVVALRAPAIAPPHPLCPPHARVASALSWEMLPKRVLHGANCLPSLASRCCRRSSSSCCGDSGCRLIPSPLIAPVTVAAYGRIQMARVTRAVSSEPNSKKVANLAAKSWQRISIPNCDEGNGGSFPISEFLRHPSGLESVLNSRALQTFERLGANTYRCTLPTIRFLNFEVAPVIDLKVVSTNEDCTVEMLSLKFEGSEALEEQNQRFSASMKNHITWDVDRTDPYLDFDPSGPLIKITSSSP